MNLLPLRSEIYLANLNPTIGGEIQKTRPVVIVSQNDMNRYMETIVVCPLTTVIHPTWRCRLQISCAGVDAEIVVDQIRAISKQRLIRKIDQLSEKDAAQLRNIITEMYGE
ncbi:MAG: type II toxin-antitoxin system PemK/MazF family toxin [Gammaproteobacteria bacterium]|nr:MAG: type II toxin-antitoxin system PemK/MazF family toxin [Gammaproteobacteria bacterium]RKZ73117.1 MAG: type II toxin-antitoxin system PemK/MazF family toxin [Gammaproteobacteria bacterium]